MTKVLKIKNGRTLLLIAMALFFLSRGLTLAVFPIFNDEAIYLQYSQAIHDDWQQNRYISMRGEWTDWKPPLQYWMAAPVIQCGNDPLIAGRSVSLLISFLGLIGFYLFAKELFSEREAVTTAILYTACPAVFFQNNQFTAETFLFSTAPFFYLALLKMMRSEVAKLPWAMVGAVLGAMLLLLKQSGFLLMVVGIVLPLARLQWKEPTGGSPASSAWDWKRFALNLACVVGVIVLSHVVARLVIPGEFENSRAQFNSRWVMPVSELFGFPIATWRANLGVVAEYTGVYYSWAVPLFFCLFVWFAWWRKNLPDLALAIMGLAGGGAVIILLRGFNEYIFNTAVVVVLLPLLARTCLLIWEMRTSWMRTGLLGVAGMMAVCWGWEVVLMNISPGLFIERSTPWAVTNYLKAWPTGFGMKQVVAMLEKETRPGVLFTDTQWGNPQTTLKIYGRTRFPSLRIVPVSKEFLDSAETRKLRDAARQMGEVRLVIFSADQSEERPQWQRNIAEQMCDTRKEIRAYPGQMPIVICSF